MAGLGPFDYLISEVEEGFFQKAAEEIAMTKEAASLGSLLKLPRAFGGGQRSIKALSSSAGKIKPKKVPKPAGIKPKNTLSQEDFQRAQEYAAQMGVAFGHGGNPAKLAMLIYMSNKENLTKQASERLSNPSSYGELVNCIAASSPWETMGMTKNALDYLDYLDDLGIDKKAVFVLGERLVYDALNTDYVIKEAFEKSASPMAAIKSAIPFLAKQTKGLGAATEAAFRPATVPIASALNKVPQGLSSLGRAAETVARPVTAPLAAADVRAGQAIKNFVGKSGRLERTGKAVANAVKPVSEAGGLRSFVSGKLRSAGTAIKAPFRQAWGKLLDRRITNRTRGVEALGAKKEQLASKLNTAVPGEAESLGAKIQDISKQMERQQKGVQKAIQQEEKLHGKVGISKNRQKSSAAEGASKAEQAASKADEAAKVKEPPADIHGKGSKFEDATPADVNDAINKARATNPELAKILERAKNKHTGTGTPPPNKQTNTPPRGDRPPNTPPKGDEPPNYTLKKDRPAPKQDAPAPAPAPKSPPPMPTPQQAEAAGIGDIYGKWKEGGWKALSDAEKRKVMTYGAGAFVGQRVILGKENAII